MGDLILKIYVYWLILSILFYLYVLLWMSILDWGIFFVYVCMYEGWFERNGVSVGEII